MTNYRSLQNNKGMTLIEVMMAVAVLGIAIVFVVQMTDASSRALNMNADQVRMMELARSEMEKSLAGYQSYSLPTNTNDYIYYPPGSDETTANNLYEKKYAIKYEIASTDTIGGSMLKITVGQITTNPPNTSYPLHPLYDSNQSNCSVVAWLPPVINVNP